MNPVKTTQEAARSKGRGITPVRIFLLVALPLTFRTFVYFPGMLHVEDAWYVLCLLGLLFVYPAWKIMTGLRFLSFEIYVLVLIVLNVFMPALRAHQVFGQPLIYGALAQRSSVLLVMPLFFFLGIVSKRLKPEDIQWAMLVLAGVLLAADSFTLFFLNPANFVSDTAGVATMVNGAPKFNLPTDLLYFGLIYHLFSGVRTRVSRHYAIAAIFLVAILLFADSRAGTVSVAVAFFYFVYRLRSGRQFSATIVKTALVVAGLAVVGLAINPTYISDKLFGFRDAFKVAFTGGNVEDASANVRIFETITAIPYIRSHPFLGNGVLSNQWQGGNLNVIGESFYPDDIGIIGVVYSVGILGMLFCVYQFRYSIWAVRQMPIGGRSPMFDAAVGNLLYWAVLSLVTGTFVFSPAITVFYIAILVALAMLKRRNEVLVPQATGSVQAAKLA